MGINEHTNIRIKIYMNDIKFVRMDGEIIDDVQSIKYLESYLSNNLLNNKNLEEKYRLTSVKKLVDFSGFYTDVSVEVKQLQLYKSYVRPVLAYGLDSLLFGHTMNSSTEVRLICFQ